VHPVYTNKRVKADETCEPAELGNGMGWQNTEILSRLNIKKYAQAIHPRGWNNIYYPAN